MTRSHRDSFLTLQRDTVEALRRGRRDEARRLLLEVAEVLYRMAADLEGPRRARRLSEARELLQHARRLASSRAASSGGRKAGTVDSGEEGPDFRLRERSRVRFDDVAGLEEVKEQIRLRLVYPFRHPEEAKRYGLRQGGGLLLFGPPGTGKTLLARAVAGEVDAAFFTVKPSEILSKWVGEAEKNIEDLFDAARAEPVSVIFVDEIDALAPRRSESSSPVMARLVPQILAEMEGFGSNREGALLFLGATNEPWLLDPAILRPGRFDELVYVGLPDLPARRKLLDIHLSGRPLAEDVNLDRLAERLDGYSGADIRRICEEAASAAFLEAVRAKIDRAIGWGDLIRVTSRTPPSISPQALDRFRRYAEERATAIQSSKPHRDDGSGGGAGSAERLRAKGDAGRVAETSGGEEGA